MGDRVTFGRRTTCLSLLCLSLCEIAGAPIALPEEKAAAPLIRLETPLAESRPESFARKLGDHLGADVRLPKRLKQMPLIEAGEYTATQLLNRAGKGLNATWEVRFEFTAAGASTQPRKSKLPPGRNLTLEAVDVGFERAVRWVEREANCVVELPKKMPAGRYRLRWREAPLEQALADLARAAGLAVRTVVLFETADEAQARQALAEEARLTHESQQQAEISHRLRELYGADPASDEFPWDGIDRPALANTLGRELDLDPATVEAMMERVRLGGGNVPDGD